MIEGMLYIFRVACPWRDLPPHFGPWSSVYTRWRRWNRSGLWARLLKLVAAEPQGVLVHLDATHVKAHQDGTNPCGGQERQAIGRTRGGLNTKVTALVDSEGRALQLVVDSGNQADIQCADRIEIPSGHRLVADKGYDSTALRDRIWDAGSCPCIPNLKNRKNPARWHRGFYKLRHRAENFFQRIKRLLRVGTRYQKLSLHFLSFVQLTAILDWLKSPFSRHALAYHTSIIRDLVLQTWRTCRPAQRHWIERTFQNANSELGMAQYEVRKWRGWHHYIVVFSLAILLGLKERIAHSYRVPLNTRDVVEFLT